MTSTTSLFYEAITGQNKNELKNEKKKTLLKQQDNIQEYKEKLGSYKAKMASSGGTSLSTGVIKNFAQQANRKNALIAQEMNEKILQNRNNHRKKTLLSLGFKASAI